jgi:TetR/AcrR family fatty acid metabolism transcriptional regulator
MYPLISSHFFDISQVPREKKRGADMGRKTEISEIRKEELTQAALKCMALKGYDRVTLDDVTREAGLSKGIASYYFKNREELLISVIQKMWENMQGFTRQIWEMPEMTDDPEEVFAHLKAHFSNPKTDLIRMFKEGVSLLITLYDENPHVLRVILEFWCQVPRNKLITEMNYSMQDFLMGTTALIMQEGAKRGVFKKRDPQFAAYTLMSIVAGFLFNHTINKGKLDSKKLEKELSDVILAYVCK